MPQRRPDIHPVLRQRWSPRSFDQQAELSNDELKSLLEAARWAPSAGNSQPWSFLLARRGDDQHRRIVRHLAPSAAAWAPAAGALIVNLCHRYVEGTDWDYSEFSVYDLGQAVAHLTIQATSMGLAVRQFRAFDKQALTTDLQVPNHWDIMTIAAVGASVAGQGAQRDRRPAHDLLWSPARKPAESEILVS
ncbi:nitroreductase family protein [Kribbella sindirgiensis]|uniref:Nitroreductase n=1 Tax=Kribbella sindirgiensis TaxID=1124744 RepID=A0A4R0IPJ7_9ACTN|nr:nitroreductase family protein [Kribbella sindirgiensis]TCC34909.1 nitroreductase [Kribbella sindirgiensis]